MISLVKSYILVGKYFLKNILNDVSSFSWKKINIWTGPSGPKAAAPQSDADDWIVWWLKGNSVNHSFICFDIYD